MRVAIDDLDAVEERVSALDVLRMIDLTNEAAGGPTFVEPVALCVIRVRFDERILGCTVCHGRLLSFCAIWGIAARILSAIGTDYYTEHIRFRGSFLCDFAATTQPNYSVP